MPDEQLHDIETVMRRTKLGRSMVFEEIRSRKLRSIKVGRRRLVSEAALCEYIAELDRQASA